MAFSSVVFTSKAAFNKAAGASNVFAVHEPFMMIVYNNLVQSTLDMRYVRYISVLDNEYSAKTGLVVCKTENDKFSAAIEYFTQNRIPIKNRFEGTQIVIVEIPNMGDAAKFITQLTSTGFFASIREDHTGKVNLSDITLEDEELPYPFFSYLQHGWLDPINAAEALATFNTIQAEMHVAILDTRVDVNHVDLVGRTAFNHDCVLNTPGAVYAADNIYVDNPITNDAAEIVPIWAKHGTPMAGIVACNSTNGILVQSHTRNKVKAQVLRVLYPVAEYTGGPVPVISIEEDYIVYYATSLSIMTCALNKAMENAKCAAISISWVEDAQTSVFIDSLLQDLMTTVITTARNCKGIPIFVAAGNDNEDLGSNASYPQQLATEDGIFCIGGTFGTTTAGSVKADFANYGAPLTVSAPAVNVYTTDATGSNGYVTNLPNPLGTTEVVRFTGTSASAPIAAGVAAIMVLVNPELSATTIGKILTETAAQVGGYTYTDGFSEELGYGLIDMQAAVEEADGYDPGNTPVDYTISITAPGTAQAGANIAIPWTVDIDPGYAAPYWTNCPSIADMPKVTFYRSALPNFTTSAATPIGFVTLSTLEPADTTVSGTFNYVVPCTVSGNMYIFAKVDSGDIIAESDEDNNMDSVIVVVSGLVAGCLPTDLAVTITGTTIAANGQRRMFIRFTNTGQTTITTWNFTHGWINNTGAPATVNVNYNLAPGQVRNISLWAIQSPQGLPNTFYTQINTVNGAADSNATNNYSSFVVTA
jgi:hypothetical protein